MTGEASSPHHDLTARRLYSLWVEAAKAHGEPVHATLGELPETSQTLVDTWYAFAALVRDYTRKPSQ